MSIPEIRLYNNKKVLYVDDKPFFMISGEIHNSSSSSISFLDPVLEKLEKLGLNSVLLPITWQQFEPIENSFDYEYVNSIIKCAESHHLKLGILWFGSWKNAAMSYCPNWVKEDLNRFKRVELIKGEHQIIRKSLILNMPFTTLSPFYEENVIADSKAFKELMLYLKEHDTNHTVITVQVENETGYLGGDFDYSDEALKEYNKEIPVDFIEFLKEKEESLEDKLKIDFNKRGTWEEVFNSNAHEVFTAFYISKYVERVAKAGKDIYPLPMGVNCWLDAKSMKPGKYPCGGPISAMMEVWMYNAKSIDYYCPDNYLFEFYQILDKFNKHNNPIYVPESKVCSKAVSRELAILGHYHGMCYAGFGIEDIGNEPKIDFSRFAWLMGFSVDSHKSYPQDFELYKTVNNLLNGSYFIFMKHYGTSDLDCYTKELNIKYKWTKTFDDIEFKTMGVPFGKTKDSATLICKLNRFEFLILGYGTISFFKSLNKELPYLEYLEIKEGYYQDNQFITTRVLNGDEEFVMSLKPTLLKVKVHLYK